MIQDSQRLTSNDSVGTGNCWDDVLDYTLRESPGDTINLELLRTIRSFVIQPLDVLWVVRIELLV